MSRLLYADFARLWKSKIFWIMEIFMAVYAGALCINAWQTSRNHAIDSWNLYFFNELLFVQLILAVLVSFYIGAEYGEGTIRNKLAVGHLRIHVYLSNLIVSYAAGIIGVCTFNVVSLALGLTLIGAEQTIANMWIPMQVIWLSLFMIMTYVSLFVMVSMAGGSKAGKAVVNLILGIAFLMATLVVQLAVVSWGDYPPSQPGARLCLLADTWLPSNQVMDAVTGLEYSRMYPVHMLVLTVFFTGIGMYAFSRKEIS